MSELEIAQSQIVQLQTHAALLRGEIVTLKENLAAARRQMACMVYPRHDFGDDRTQAEIDREEKGEHEADLERSGH